MMTIAAIAVVSVVSFISGAAVLIVGVALYVEHPDDQQRLHIMSLIGSNPDMEEA